MPAVDASKMPMAVTVPHDTVGVGNVIMPALLICEGAVEPPVMADQPLELVTATRAYEPPVTSVPVNDALASVDGFTVNNPTQVVTGAAPHAPVVGHVVPFIQFNTLF